MSFIQRFGAKLNFHPHFHFCFADGVFGNVDGRLHFFDATLTPDDLQDTEDRIRNRVLKIFRRKGWLQPGEVDKMLGWANSGFSLDATVWIEAWDREGLERLIRYCAKPPFASENLRWNHHWLEYRLSKPMHDGLRSIQLTPEGFFDRLVPLFPPFRRHRHHYSGVFAPNAPMRRQVTAYANKRLKEPKRHIIKKMADKTHRVSLTWAELIARIYEDNPLLCPCGGKMRIIAFITCPYAIRKILSHMGLPIEVPQFDPPADPFDWEMWQLIRGTEDGFPVEHDLDDTPDGFPPEGGPYPPHQEVHEADVEVERNNKCQLVPGTADGFPPDIEPLPEDWDDNISI